MAKRGRPQQYDVRLTLPLTHRQHDQLAVAASMAGVAQAEIARRALDAYLEPTTRDNKEEAA